MKNVFGRIYAIVENKYGCIKKYADWIGSKWEWEWEWHIPLRRNLLDWEIDMWEKPLDVLNSITLSPLVSIELFGLTQ